MERRFNDQLQRHEDSERVHSAMRHAWVNDVLAPKWLEIERERTEMALRITNTEIRLNTIDLASAAALGEARANRRILRWGFALVSLIVTVFGGAILAAVNIHHP